MSSGKQIIYPATWSSSGQQDSAYQFQKEVEAKRRIIVGVNEYVEPAQEKIATERALAGVRQASRDGSNLMRPLIEAVKAPATGGGSTD